jgi:uncharacterized protein YfaS (alpha-2-macroglobulin family)
VEQTTSAVFPQLYLADIMDVDANKKAEIQRNINAGIQKLGNFQLSNGGLSYWQGNNYVDDWATSYAGHFLIEAEKKGYVLPIGFKNKWISFQQSEAKKWRFNAVQNQWHVKSSTATHKSPHPLNHLKKPYFPAMLPPRKSSCSVPAVVWILDGLILLGTGC